MFPLLYKNNPTIDIYFASPMRRYINNKSNPFSARPIRRIGPNSFLANNKIVVIRYITRKELADIKRHQPSEIFFVVDDDFSTITTDTSLPADYRAKLEIFSQDLLPDLVSMTKTVVSGNMKILNEFADKRTLFLNPSYTSLCQDFTHFNDHGTIDILFSGTRSHLNDLRFIVPALNAICQKYINVSITTFLGKHVPSELTRLDNITHRQPLSWNAYQKMAKTTRFHIALAPYLETAFNQGRSINKILDHAAFGAAGIYSNISPLNKVIDNNRNGILLDQVCGHWEEAIDQLVTQMDKTENIARAGVSLAENVGNPQLIQKFWFKELLGRQD